MGDLGVKNRADRWLVVGGLSLLVVQGLILATTLFQYGMIIIATLLFCAGMLGLGSRAQTERRIYLQLRSEVDHFINLVRQINDHAVAGEGKQVTETKKIMHESVERIAQAAGVVEGTDVADSRL